MGRPQAVAIGRWQSVPIFRPAPVSRIRPLGYQDWPQAMVRDRGQSVPSFRPLGYQGWPQATVRDRGQSVASFRPLGYRTDPQI